MILFKNQIEYNQFYDKLHKYAKLIANRYSLSEVDIDVSLDKVVNWLISGSNKSCEIKNPFAFAKKIIDNSLKNSSRDRKIELVSLKEIKNQMVQIDGDFPQHEDDNEYDNENKISYINTGWNAFEVKDKRGYPKTTLDKISNYIERQIVELYLEGATQFKTSEILNVSQPYISKVLKKYITISHNSKKTSNSLVKVYDSKTGLFKHFEKSNGKTIVTGLESNQLPINI